MQAHYGKSGYSNHHCGCEYCTHQWKLYTRGVRQQRKDMWLKLIDGKWVCTNPKVTHGDNCYKNWGCRCVVCTTAQSANKTEWKRRTKRNQAKIENGT